MKPIRLAVVDDHTLFRRGLIALLAQDGRFEVVFEAGDAGAALRASAQFQPDLILLDNHLPGVRGVDAIAALKERTPDAHILMLTVSEDEADLVAALHAGADGYLLKTINSEDLCESIVKVLDGDSVISPEMTSKLVAAFRTRSKSISTAALSPAAPAAADSLSQREREILLRIAQGESNKTIGRALDIAETTVKTHVQHLLRKLNLSSRVQAAAYAAERSLI